MARARGGVSGVQYPLLNSCAWAVSSSRTSTGAHAGLVISHLLNEERVRDAERLARESFQLGLPPELVKLLRTEFTARPDDDLVWRTEEGNPLVRNRADGQASDSVRQFWDELRERAKVPDALSFKYLRKFLADYCDRHGGEEIGAVAMSHSRRTVLARNYSTGRPFARFHELQRQMYRELSDGGMFRVVQSKPEPPSRCGQGTRHPRRPTHRGDGTTAVTLRTPSQPGSQVDRVPGLTCGGVPSYCGRESHGGWRASRPEETVRD